MSSSVASELSEYEKQRLANIAKNMAMLRKLGIAQVSEGVQTRRGERGGKGEGVARARPSGSKARAATTWGAPRPSVCPPPVTPPVTIALVLQERQELARSGGRPAAAAAIPRPRKPQQARAAGPGRNSPRLAGRPPVARALHDVDDEDEDGTIRTAGRGRCPGFSVPRRDCEHFGHIRARVEHPFSIASH